jgi:hypothetical protein
MEQALVYLSLRLSLPQGTKNKTESPKKQRNTKKKPKTGNQQKKEVKES